MSNRALLAVLAAFSISGSPGSALSADAPVVRPKILAQVMPEYPPLARRYNIQGRVVVNITVDAHGNVKTVSAVSYDADILLQSVEQAVRQWKFAAPDKEATFPVAFPFRLTAGEYAYDTQTRAITASPTNAKKLSGRVMDGWCDIRILIGIGGVIEGKHIMKISDPLFQSTLEKILAEMKFEGGPDDAPGYKSTTVNQFAIRVSGSAVEITQKAGD